jgi:iron complex transport system permease protein
MLRETPWRVSRPVLLTSLGAGLLAMLALGLCVGAYRISLADLVSLALTPASASPIARTVVFEIRLPRLGLGVLVGAGLGAAGATLQAIFRNPLAEPGLIGVSSGAAMGAASATVLLPMFGIVAGAATLQISAFICALATVSIVYRLAIHDGRLRIESLLLAGIVMNVLVGAGIGLLTYLASDAQLREISFWNLGSLAGARWQALRSTALPTLIGLAVLLWHAGSLTMLQLGETEAHHLGVAVDRLKRHTMIACTVCVAALVALTGVISFVGLVAPHCVRLLAGPDQRTVLPGAILLGALLTISADLLARTIAAPQDIPLGILTALLGAPFFLILLLRQRGEQPC